MEAWQLMANDDENKVEYICTTANLRVQIVSYLRGDQSSYKLTMILEMR